MTDAVRTALASGAGLALAGATRVTASLRTAAKPLHPRGTTWSATLVRSGQSASGVPWLDEPGVDRARFRRSRAAGLPRGWPDVHGLAIRVETEDGRMADVLLASTGRGPFTRFALRPGRQPASMFFGSLLPYRSSAGPVLLGAVLREDSSWDLLWTVGRGPWAAFGRLLPEERLPRDETSYDPVLNRPPGLGQYDVWARMRRPAYRTARRTRRQGITAAGSGTRSA